MEVRIGVVLCCGGGVWRRCEEVLYGGGAGMCCMVEGHISAVEGSDQEEPNKRIKDKYSAMFMRIYYAKTLKFYIYVIFVTAS